MLETRLAFSFQLSLRYLTPTFQFLLFHWILTKSCFRKFVWRRRQRIRIRLDPMVLWPWRSWIFHRGWWRLYQRQFQPTRAQRASNIFQVSNSINNQQIFCLLAKQCKWSSQPTAQTQKTWMTRTSWRSTNRPWTYTASSTHDSFWHREALPWWKKSTYSSLSATARECSARDKMFYQLVSLKSSPPHE